MVLPVNKGFDYQMLQVLIKTGEDAISQTEILPVRFVPLVRKK